jgi:hypothetical protein
MRRARVIWTAQDFKPPRELERQPPSEEDKEFVRAIANDTMRILTETTERNRPPRKPMPPVQAKVDATGVSAELKAIVAATRPAPEGDYQPAGAARRPPLDVLDTL